MNAVDAMNHSYRVQRTYPAGSFVSVNEILNRRVCIDSSTREWKWADVQLLPGESFEVVHYTNAGFRGIEVSLKMEDGRMVHGISAGHLTAPWEAH